MSAVEDDPLERHPGVVRLVKRAWRARERSLNRAPLSDKVVHPRVLVDAPAAPKKGRAKK